MSASISHVTVYVCIPIATDGRATRRSARYQRGGNNVSRGVPMNMKDERLYVAAYVLAVILAGVILWIVGGLW